MKIEYKLDYVPEMRFLRDESKGEFAESKNI